MLDFLSAEDAWRRLTGGDGAVDPASLARRLAGSFAAARGAAPDWRAIDLLCALAAGDAGGRQAALAALYGTIVIPLCDDFSPEGVAVCDQVLARVIDFVRRSERGQGLAAALDRLGLADRTALLARHRRLASFSPPPLAAAAVRKVAVLSRVTVGADVVITSVIVHRLLAVLPEAEVVVIGPAHLGQIFAGLARVRCLELAYERNGSLFDRLLVWEPLDDLLRREEEGLAPGALLVVDPDSRLSQLGLLPLAAEEATRHFPSRLNPWPERNPSLNELVNGWLDRLLGGGDPLPPMVALPAAIRTAASGFCQRLRAAGCRFLVVANYGVGGDDNKRLGEPFETALLPALLAGGEGTVVVLDSGCAQEEYERVQAQLAWYREQGIATDFVEEAALADREIAFGHGVVGFRGAIGAIGGLIAGADAFFGYDSCCQHLAGAIATPAVIVFAGAPNERFAARWYPHDASGAGTVIPVAGRAAASDRAGAGALIERVAAAMAAIRAKGNL